jgi:bacillithiol biosynthesis cysteine-adding enzyme BshC
MRASFSAAFLRGDSRAASFLALDFRDPQTRCRMAQQAAQRFQAGLLHQTGPGLHPEVLAALQRQEQALGIAPSAARSAHLQALEPRAGQPGTAVVITGQQVGLFLGPLFTFFKAASVIAVARAMEQESGVRCVPLFWLQTEDHDYAEIDHCYTYRPGSEPLKSQLVPDDEAASVLQQRTSIAHRCLPRSIVEQLDALQEALAELPMAADFLQLLRAHYRPGASLSGAFASVLSEVFSDEGLLVFDPRQAQISALARPLYQRVLTEHDTIAELLLARTAQLHSAGLAEQVHVRKAASLLFFHDGEVAGPRYRLERTTTGFEVPGQRFDQDQLLALMQLEPLRFSTSALLRPCLQDTLFPTAAYVSGPGEMSYFAQLAPLYQHLGVPQPLVVPRARLRLIEDSTRSLLGKLGLSATDAELPRVELLRRIHAASPATGSQSSAEALRAQLLGELPARLDELAASDGALQDPVRKARRSIEYHIDRLVTRAERAALERDQVLAARVGRLQLALFPQETPQERFYSLPYFACKHGLAALKQKLFALLAADSAAAFQSSVRDLAL